MRYQVWFCPSRKGNVKFRQHSENGILVTTDNAIPKRSLPVLTFTMKTGSWEAKEERVCAIWVVDWETITQESCALQKAPKSLKNI